MKQTLLTLMLVGTFLINTNAQDSIFAKGEKSPNVNHTGNVWLNELAHADSIFSYSTALATFDPSSRLNWHSHPGGQILMITSGVGYYQERGKPKQTVKKGDVIKCLPNVEHWHGSTADNGFAYIATSPVQKGKTKWLEKVTDKEYFGDTSSANAAQKATTPLASASEKELITLSKTKWSWMADKNVDSLSSLFHEKSMFVHMGGTWGKEQEINVIKTGGIWYKKADVYSVTVNQIGSTAIVLNDIDLVAVVAVTK